MGKPAVWRAARSRRTVRVVTARSVARFVIVFVRTAASCRSSVHCRISSLLRAISDLPVPPHVRGSVVRCSSYHGSGFRFGFAHRGLTDPVIAGGYSHRGAMVALRSEHMTEQAAAQAVVDAVGQVTFGSETK